MMKWIKTIRAPKFYRYWYYRQYKLSESLGDGDAEYSSVIGSAMVILFHFTFFLFFVGNGVFDLDVSNFLFDKKRILLAILLSIMLLLLCHIFFFYNGKWKITVQEFENESEKSRRKGLYYLLIYLFISLFCLFPICIIFFFTEKV